MQKPVIAEMNRPVESLRVCIALELSIHAKWEIDLGRRRNMHPEKLRYKIYNQDTQSPTINNFDLMRAIY
jgi:hypothetical protein